MGLFKGKKTILKLYSIMHIGREVLLLHFHLDLDLDIGKKKKTLIFSC